MNAHVTLPVVTEATSVSTSDKLVFDTACRDCSGWKIAAERALEALLDEMAAGTYGGRVRLDISAARLDELVGDVGLTDAEATAGCAAIRCGATEKVVAA